jgi:hypothetical protein
LRSGVYVIVIIVLVGIIAGFVAGILACADGKSIPGAILYGGSTFAGTVTLILLMMAAIRLAA